MNFNNYQCNGQMDMFGYMESIQPLTIQSESNDHPRLNVGDVIGRIILGEVEKGTIYKIEGNGENFFYRTTACCFGKNEGSTDLESLERQAEEIRKDYKTIIPVPLEKKVTVKYPPRQCDGYIMTAQIGIFQGMLYWREAYTYEFLVPYQNEKDLMKAYDEKLHKITDKNTNDKEWEEIQEPTEINRLYWSKHGFYANARYVEHEH